MRTPSSLFALSTGSSLRRRLARSLGGASLRGLAKPAPSLRASLVAAAFLLMAGGTAGAGKPGGEPAAARRRTAVALRSGIVLPQLSSELGTALGVELDVGYRVWRNLSPYLGLGYSQPVVDHESMDPRITELGGAFTTSTTQRELTITAGAQWRFRPPTANLNGYGAVGARAYLLETLTNGEANGSPFLENRETSTRLGGVAAVGAELRLGPGAALAELELGGSDLPHLITGDVSTMALGLSVGFRIFF